MSLICLIIILLTLINAISGQRAGTSKPEVHPPLKISRCTGGRCKIRNNFIVVDADYRWLHSGSESCVINGAFNTNLCPADQPAKCSQNCALEGADYADLGISTSGNSLTLKLFNKNHQGRYVRIAPRVFLLDEDGENHELLSLLGKEISFNVDVSNTPCGVNGALYLTEMRRGGSRSELNAAGSKYGTGYCDAQCRKNFWVDGKANVEREFGSCCNEFDIWEANKEAASMSSHPCNIQYPYSCTGIACGEGNNFSKGVCVRQGCDFNSYRNNATSFYGPGKTLNTNAPFTVTTRFVADPAGKLVEIKRFYTQNGRIIHNSDSAIHPRPEGSNHPARPITSRSITDPYCTAIKAAFRTTDNYTPLGGTAGMGAALSRGMVMVFSIWNDPQDFMLWLDSTYPTHSVERHGEPGWRRGPCAMGSGREEELVQRWPEARVTFSDIRIGDIRSTVASEDSWR